jgi:hypothetical protein
MDSNPFLEGNSGAQVKGRLTAILADPIPANRKLKECLLELLGNSI